MGSLEQFSTAISNNEHLEKPKKVYNTEVLPFLKENRFAYQKYKAEKLNKLNTNLNQ
jgi:hypothetical protein